MLKLCASFPASVVRSALSSNRRWRRNNVPACTVGLALAWLLLAGAAGAADNSWKGSTSTNWSDVGNWNAGHVPTSSEVVRLDNLSTANLNMVNNACSPGDVNCDGNVDAGDYVYWRKTLGSAADYTAILANFGTSPGIGLPILGIASTSVSSVGPNISGTPTAVTITGKPLRIGATGLIMGSGNPLDPVYPGPAQVNTTVDTDVYLTSDQRWKMGGPGTNVSGRNQALILGASPNSHTVYLNGFKPSISVISNGHDMLIVNSKLVDGTAPSKIFISKATGTATTFAYDTGNVNTHERVRFMGDNTYSGGTDILGGRQLIQIGSSSVKVGSTIVSGPFGTGPINTVNDTFTGFNNQTPNFDAFGADRTIDNDINCGTSCTINIASSDGVDDDTSAHTLTFGGTINIPASAQILQTDGLHTGSSLSHIAGSGDAVFNGTILLAGDSTATRVLTLGHIGGTSTFVAGGKQVFNGVISQPAASGSYSVTISGGSATSSPAIVQFNAQNTYSGGTTITSADPTSPTAGANIGLGVDTVLSGTTIVSGPVGTGTLNIGSASSATTSSVEALGGARTVANPINLALLQSKLVVRGSNDLTLNGAIGGSGGVTMNGTGKLTLGGANAYANATAVNTGTLLVNGSLSTTIGVTVASGATLGGTGSISSPITNNGTIAPGAGVGTLNVTGDVNDQASSSWAIELSGATSDLLAVTGNINLSGSDTVNVTGAGTGASWIIATYTGSLTGNFLSATSGYSLDYNTTGQIILRTPGSGAGGGLGQAAVPEPGTISLGLFAVGLATVIRRRNRGKR